MDDMEMSTGDTPGVTVAGTEMTYFGDHGEFIIPPKTIGGVAMMVIHELMRIMCQLLLPPARYQCRIQHLMRLWMDRNRFLTIV